MRAKKTTSASTSLKKKFGGLASALVAKCISKNSKKANEPTVNRNGIIKIAFLIVAIVFVGNYFFGSKNQNETSNVSDNRKEVQGAKASQELNKEIIFPLKDAYGNQVSQIKFVIEKAELRDEIVVKGQKATAISGRTFLILTLKVTNEHNQAVEIDTRDYVRLSVNGKVEEWLAPDIHNDPVEVQAISTKYSRVGFPIDDGDVDMRLKLGEINGEKEEVVLELK